MALISVPVDIPAFQAGDQKAFLLVYRNYKSLVFSCAYLILKTQPALVKDGALNDIVTDTFAKLNQHKEKFTIEAHIRNFLCFVARNEAKNILKSKTRKIQALYIPTDPDELQAQIEAASPSTAEQDLAQIVAKERKQQLHAQLELLQPHHKKVIQQFYLEEIPISEIKEAMNTSENTIRSWIRKALEIMRKRL